TSPTTRRPRVLRVDGGRRRPWSPGHFCVRYWPGGTRAAVSAGRSALFVKNFIARAPCRSFEARCASQHLEGVDPGVVAVAPGRRQAVATHGEYLFQSGLLLAEAGVLVHLALVRAF